MLPGVDERSERLAEVDQPYSSWTILTFGDAWEGQRSTIYVHWVNSQSSKNGLCFSSAYSVQCLASTYSSSSSPSLLSSLLFFLTFWVSSHLPFFPPFSSLRCSSLAPRGKRGGIGWAGTWRWKGRTTKTRRRTQWWWRRRRGGRGTGSSCRCWRRWCWAGCSAPRWSWRRWRRCVTPARRRRAAAPALDASTRSSPCSWREKKGELFELWYDFLFLFFL